MRSWTNKLWERRASSTGSANTSNHPDDGSSQDLAGTASNENNTGGTGGGTNPADGFMGFNLHRTTQDARMERLVSFAARNLGDGVQEIVLAAKAKPDVTTTTTTTRTTTSSWKSDLIQLLEANDVDTLLENAACEKFVLRCVENELPPNMIHCLRLLRVLELQHAAEAQARGETITSALSEAATKKVAQLLCLLCSDAVVGEQLRPHLFGLLALSGASYPASGVHVAQAASDVIGALAEHCLTRQLVWFIHDRKMILHMTDDVKELCGMSEALASSNVPLGLVGAQAEEAGLWLIGLTTIIKFIYFSCRFQTVDLVKDFEGAGGYKVIRYAIEHSTRTHGKGLIDLLALLACCPLQVAEEDNESVAYKLASNTYVFDIFEELYSKANPVVREFRREHNNELPDLDKEGGLLDMAQFSLKTALQLRINDGTDSVNEDIGFDMSSELLDATLQLFSDHPDNFETLEGRHHVLTFYILALPCYTDEDLKIFVLKTLEFVLTGVGVGDQVMPVNAIVEVFFALCMVLLQNDETVETRADNEKSVLTELSADLELMGSTLEKLLQFDQRVAPLMVESGLLTTNLNALLDLIAAHTEGRKAKDGTSVAVIPPSSTHFDSTFIIVCGVLKLLVAHKPVNYSTESETTLAREDSSNLHTLLRMAVWELGTDALFTASNVFEAYMSSFASLVGLKSDIEFVLKLLDSLGDINKEQGADLVDTSILQREAIILSMLRGVLEARSLARDAFRECSGFDALVRLMLSFRGAITSSTASDGYVFGVALLKLLQSTFGLLEAAVGTRSRNPITSGGLSPLMLPMEVAVDPISSQLSASSPACANSNYIRRSTFYLDYAAAIVGTGLLQSEQHAERVFEAAFGHMDPALSSLDKIPDAVYLRNPDAARLVLGLAVYTNASSSRPIAERAVTGLLRLCEPDKAASTLPQLATCGLCWSLTSQNEFAPVLFNTDCPLQGQYYLLLQRLASCSMSFVEFVSILRCIGGPLMSCDDVAGHIRLPVISSSVSRTSMARSRGLDSVTPRWHEEDFSGRMKCLCDIAENGDAFSRLGVGGDTINTIAVLMHSVKLEDRLRAVAETGRLRYIEIESIDSSVSENSAALTGSGTTAERVWFALAQSGFTYSIWLRHEVEQGKPGNLHVLDISSPSLTSASSQAPAFLSVWYDLQTQRFNVMSSASYRAEPTSFPVSPLDPFVWHHVLITYTPAKRSVLSRKSAFSLFVDGRHLEAEVKVDTVSLPPNSRVVIGAPNAALAVSGIVRGALPSWDTGVIVMLSTVLLELDATAIFSYGPDFPSLLWGDRPQRLSLAATATTLFSMLAENGEAGSLASALRRRDIPKIESAGYSMAGYDDKDSLASHNLFCRIPPDSVVFALQANTISSKLKNEASKGARGNLTERLVNLARLNADNEAVSTDAVVYGKACSSTCLAFSESVRWAGGPFLLIPLVNQAQSKETLALALRLIRLSVRRHQPNLEMMQARGGYRILAVILQEKIEVDQRSLDECLAFAICGFPVASQEPVLFIPSGTDGWALVDLDAMKNLLLNHQVWDLKKYGPDIPLRLLVTLNRLVEHNSVHKAFNARRLHLAEIVRWALHIMIEAAELYTIGEFTRYESNNDSTLSAASWYSPAPSAIEVSVGADPGNVFLQECKNLLRRVLTFMLTPGDLEALAEAIVHTIHLRGLNGSSNKTRQSEINRSSSEAEDDERMLPAPTMRLYLIRLLEELIVDGVNEIVASHASSGKKDTGAFTQLPFQPHTAGVASPNQPYLATSGSRGRKKDGGLHPKHQQAQAFLSAFTGFLTPVWFATVLEGCREEASASALLRLMMLMLQGSQAFEASFQAAGSFAPFVLSVPKFSTCPGIMVSLLSQMLNAPILHLHSLPLLDPSQLCEMFDAESRDEGILHSDTSDPSSGVFALLAECLGRNIQLIGVPHHQLRDRALQTNNAIFELLAHRHEHSARFRQYSFSPAFLEPLSQALCLVHEQQSRPVRMRRRSRLADVPKDLSPTERFIGGSIDAQVGGLRMIQLLRMVLSKAISAGPRAAVVVDSLFHSFPIHATPQQVEAFHNVLVEHCCSVVGEKLQSGDSLALANCIGLCSVFLDQELNGFLSSEDILQSLKTSVLILKELVLGEAARSLSAVDHTILCLDAAHIARLSSVTALRASRSAGVHDSGDEDLQAEVLSVINANIEVLLLLSSRDRNSMKRVPNGALPKPATSARAFPLWQSTNVSRCLSARPSSYPDLKDCEETELAVIAPLMVSLHNLLISGRDDIRSLAIEVLVAFLQHRQGVMSQLLVTEVQQGGRTETIDVVNRGGFRALLAAHEAASAAETNSAASSVRRKYSSFFEWFEKNQDQVQLVFDSVRKTSVLLFPELDGATISQQEAVETEQQAMLERLTTQGNADRTILGGLERSDLARRCFENTADSHVRWKRHGFDDLAYGAMKWKILLRQLKGTHSIWEGGSRIKNHRVLDLDSRIASLEDVSIAEKTSNEFDLQRWKLDLSEGYESQRRRLLPNYEFHGLYNIDECAEADGNQEGSSALNDVEIPTPDIFVAATQMEATTALLKDLNLKRTHRSEEDEDLDDDCEDGTIATTDSHASLVDGIYAENCDELDTGSADKISNQDETTLAPTPKAPQVDLDVEAEDSSSYELINGLLQAGDRPEGSYNTRRCTGLEVTQALLLWCRDAIYIIDGFEQTGGNGSDGKITRVEREQSSFNISLRPKGFVQRDEKTDEELSGWAKAGMSKFKRESSQSREHRNEVSTNEVIYQHRSQRISFQDLYSVYRRRYQLQQNALEFYDVDKRGTLIAFDSNKDREEVLSKVLQARLPNSIFHSTYGSFTSYSKLMTNLRAKIISQWVQGKLTNFDFLMHLNSLAGRSFNDLTQYPVFPWVIADYDSEEIDLDDPNTYRDLSKPMGALGEERAQQFRDRYEALSSTCLTDDDPPPFHYGTHYSCAAYVLYYMMRLEPFSRLALALQGGKFDVADRLFHDVGRSWHSASTENLQDVRELIPEFFYLPEFLENTNDFDFGETQKGKTVHDVSLPKWAKGDPKRFVRLNRQALESEYVSRNLHHWVDLIFGCKQQGQQAVDSLNMFVHVTYEGEVDIDTMTDPIQRASTIAQIQNFGQTPSRLERRPFPPRVVTRALKDKMVDLTALPALAPLTPPFCIVGAPHRVVLRVVATETCKLGLGLGQDHSVGDMWYGKGQLIGVGRSCALVLPSKKYFRFGGVNNGLSVHTAAVTTRNREVNKLVSFHDSLHRAPIVAARTSLDGKWLITGCVDSTIRVWKYIEDRLVLKATLCGHDGWPITCIDVSTECGVLVTGCGQGRVILWDLRTLTYVRALQHAKATGSAISVSINHMNGNIVTLIEDRLSAFDINGKALASVASVTSDRPTCAIATNCPEWMEEGVAAITGHLSGSVKLWALDYDREQFLLRHVVDENNHTSPITALRATGVDRQDTVLIGDSAGRMSVCKTVHLDSFSAEELKVVGAELK